ncbi:hypothetical protein AAFX91_42175, partial [Bradyrhizobium sp. 31Argb]|uniref:hypothetical protein n=1 Tax=Bradyrhizobium sp. 31Argb TaxID=3141247 RepID=UPI003747AAD7
ALGQREELKAKLFHVQSDGARRDSDGADKCAGPDNVIVVPMEITIDLAHGFGEVRRVVASECAQLREHDSFARDLSYALRDTARCAIGPAEADWYQAYGKQLFCPY